MNLYFQGVRFFAAEGKHPPEVGVDIECPLVRFVVLAISTMRVRGSNIHGYDILPTVTGVWVAKSPNLVRVALGSLKI